MPYVLILSLRLQWRYWDGILNYRELKMKLICFISVPNICLDYTPEQKKEGLKNAKTLKMAVRDATLVRELNSLKRTWVKPTSVSSSGVMPVGRGALFSSESNINPFFYFWFSDFVSFGTLSLVYKITDSSVLWRQPVVLYCIVVGSRRLMPPEALQPKAYCTNPGL